MPFYDPFLKLVRRLLAGFQGTRRRRGQPLALPPALLPEPVAAGGYGPLKRLVLTDGVSRTLFEEYHDHRKGERGDEETGWVLMGLRHEHEALVLATLPA